MRSYGFCKFSGAEVVGGVMLGASFFGAERRGVGARLGAGAGLGAADKLGTVDPVLSG